MQILPNQMTDENIELLTMKDKAKNINSTQRT